MSIKMENALRRLRYIFSERDDLSFVCDELKMPIRIILDIFAEAIYLIFIICLIRIVLEKLCIFLENLSELLSVALAVLVMWLVSWEIPHGYSYTPHTIAAMLDESDVVVFIRLEYENE